MGTNKGLFWHLDHGEIEKPNTTGTVSEFTQKDWDEFCNKIFKVSEHATKPEWVWITSLHDSPKPIDDPEVQEWFRKKFNEPEIIVAKKKKKRGGRKPGGY